MVSQARYNRFRLIIALSLLAALLVITPGHAQAAGATLCSTSSSGADRASLAQTNDTHQAGLVIDFGDGRVMTFCIDLGADGQATGEEFLRASNLPVIIDYGFGMGGAICKIDNVGSDFPAEPCFSHCTFQPGETCVYWVYSQLVDDHWQFLQTGAGGTIVLSGDVYGWAWGESTIARGAEPPVRTLAQICLPATATATTSPTPTPTTSPTATQPPPAPPAPPPATTTPYVARVITATPTVSATPTRTPTSSPVAAQPTPTSAPVQANAPTAPPAPIPPSPTLPPLPPTATATAAPVPTDTPPVADTRGGLPAPETSNRGAEASTRIQIPLIQHSIAATPAATAGRTARAALSAPPSATSTPAAATPAPVRQRAPTDNPTGTYPYFGGTAAFLLAGWAMLRRGRARRSP